MSISTLKKKTNAAYNILSVGQNQFSINGCLRNQGYIGQDSLSRTTDFLKDGYVGFFPLNNPSVIKPTVLNNSGLISTKYRWTKRGKPFTNVKTLGGKKCSTYTKNIHNLNSQCIKKPNSKKDIDCIKSCIKSNNYNHTIKKTFGNPNKTAINSCSHYIEDVLTSKCIDASCNKLPSFGTPFACGVVSKINTENTVQKINIINTNIFDSYGYPSFLLNNNSNNYGSISFMLHVNIMSTEWIVPIVFYNLQSDTYIILRVYNSYLYFYSMINNQLNTLIYFPFTFNNDIFIVMNFDGNNTNIIISTDKGISNSTFIISMPGFLINNIKCNYGLSTTYNYYTITNVYLYKNMLTTNNINSLMSNFMIPNF